MGLGRSRRELGGAPYERPAPLEEGKDSVSQEMSNRLHLTNVVAMGTVPYPGDR